MTGLKDTERLLRARRTAQNWGLRCCSPNSLSPWLEAAIKESRRSREYRPEVTLEWFCREADSRWCAVKQIKGRCVLLDRFLEAEGKGT